MKRTAIEQEVHLDRAGPCRRRAKHITMFKKSRNHGGY